MIILYYFIFTILLFIPYWTIASKSIKIQNYFLFIANIIFYYTVTKSIDYLILLLSITFFDYFIGILMFQYKKYSKSLLIIGISKSLITLFIFKYYSANNLNDFESLVILPLGLSFYLFHGITYLIDIYKNKIKPIFNFVNFSIYINIYTLLLSGPIENSKLFLPQIAKVKTFNLHKIVNSLCLIIYGLFKKIVIADNISYYTKKYFLYFEDYNSTTLFITIISFSIQIYADFSGYSDIALGTSSLFGYDVTRNFNFPYFSRNIKEFWNRWHISLTNLFKEYIYIPLGGSKVSYLNTNRNILIIFLLSSLWHGFSLNYIIWGICHFIYYFIYNSLNFDFTLNYFNSIINFFKILLNFVLISFFWVFFYFTNVKDAFLFYQKMFFNSEILTNNNFNGKILIVYIVIFFLLEKFYLNYLYMVDDKKSSSLFYLSIYIILIILLSNVNNYSSDFIYFAF